MYYIGIDVGGTNIKAGLVTADGTIVNRAQRPSGSQRLSSEIAADMVALAKEVSTGVSDIQSIGIGVPGACNDEKGTIIYTANMNFRDFPIRDFVQSQLAIPVHIGNDANCAALGEYFMLPDKVQDMVFITLGTGIGGGLIINGNLYTGSNGIAGEVGHLMIQKGGKPCGCGRRGCWEAYASVTALIEQTITYAKQNPDSAVAKACGADFSAASGKTSFLLAKAGDAGAQSIVDTWIGYVADGIVDMVNLFQPALILIGGAISREGDVLLNPIREIVERDMYKSDTTMPTLRIAELGNDAGLIGAAFLGR